MSYRQLLANLEALPEGDRQLAGGVYLFTDEGGTEICGCVLGKGVPLIAEHVRSHYDLNADAGFCEDMFGDDTVRLAASVNLTPEQARRAQHQNDRFGMLDDEENDPAQRRARYLHMIEWLRARVAEEATSAASAASAAPSIPNFGSPGCAGGDCGKDGGGRNE